MLLAIFVLTYMCILSYDSALQMGEAPTEEDMDKCKQYIAAAKVLNPNNESVSLTYFILK